MKNQLETLLPLQLLQRSPHSFSVSAARCSNCCCLCTSNQWCQNQYSKLKPADKPSTETVLCTNQCEFLLLNSRSKSDRITSTQRPLILLHFTCVVFLRSSMLVFIFFIAAKKNVPGKFMMVCLVNNKPVSSSLKVKFLVCKILWKTANSGFPAGVFTGKLTAKFSVTRFPLHYNIIK